MKMDGEPEREEDEVETDTGRDESTSGKGGVPAEVDASHHEEENSQSVKRAEEPSAEAAASEISGAHIMTTREDPEVRKTEVSERTPSHRGTGVSGTDGDGDDGPPELHLGTPEGEAPGPSHEEEKEDGEEEFDATPAENEGVAHEKNAQILREPRQEGDEASRRSGRPQRRPAGRSRKKAEDDAQPEGETPEPGQLQEYEKRINILSGVKRQLAADSEKARRQAEELRLQAQEKLDKVENEWQAFLALKQHVAVTVLSRRLGKRAAQARVESTLAAEQLRQDELIKLRLKHIKLRIKVHRLEAELRDREDHGRDPLQLQFEQLQAARLEQKKQTEKESEELLKLQSKISRSLELLSNIKEKLFWSQMEVQAKREQLAKLEATVARKRDLLTRTKQSCNSLRKDNLSLKERRGLLGNRFLLWDFENTVDASSHLEEKLENLKGRQAEIVSTLANGGQTWKQPNE